MTNGGKFLAVHVRACHADFTVVGGGRDVTSPSMHGRVDLLVTPKLPRTCRSTSIREAGNMLRYVYIMHGPCRSTSTRTDLTPSS